MTGRLQFDPHFQLEPEKLYLWSWRWMDAQRMVSDKKEDQIAAIKAHLERMNEIEKWLKKSSDAGSVPPYSVHEAEFYRLEAEKWLSEAKRK